MVKGSSYSASGIVNWEKSLRNTIWQYQVNLKMPYDVLRNSFLRIFFRETHVSIWDLHIFKNDHYDRMYKTKVGII